jgi:uncharacterized membrane protein
VSDEAEDSAVSVPPEKAPDRKAKVEHRPPWPGDKMTVRAEYFGFFGPLPPPDILTKYNAAFPGCAERIVKMAEEQAEHRRGLEAAVVRSNLKRQGIAQVLGFVAFTLVCGGAFSLFWIGKDATAIGILVANLLGFGGAYVLGQRKQDRELKEKRKPFESAAQRPNREDD